jgi:hypothetical protein
MSATRARTSTGLTRIALAFALTVSNLSLYSIILDITNVVLDGAAAGNEAILFCDKSDFTSWCCDANRSFNCCTESDATTFSLRLGAEVATIGTSTMTSSTVTSSTAESTSSSISDGMKFEPLLYRQFEANY